MYRYVPPYRSSTAVGDFRGGGREPPKEVIDFRHAQEKWREDNSQFLLKQPSRRLVKLFVNLD
jgi:hypothetical protein